MTMLNAQALSDDEVLSLGLSPIVNGGQMADPLDNALVDEMLKTGNLPQTDKDGRPIISFSQFLRMRKHGDISRYSLWMELPGRRGAWTMQASKYIKYFRKGYEAIGAPAEHRHTIDELLLIGMTPQAAAAAVWKPRKKVTREVPVDSQDDDITLFYCRDKYPDCKRVFDTRAGLAWHWKRDHGEVTTFRKPRARRAVESAEV